MLSAGASALNIAVLGGLDSLRGTELAPGQLHLPAGVAVTSDNSVYVTSPVFGPAGISRVQ